MQVQHYMVLQTGWISCRVLARLLSAVLHSEAPRAKTSFDFVITGRVLCLGCAQSVWWCLGSKVLFAELPSRATRGMGLSVAHHWHQQHRGGQPGQAPGMGPSRPEGLPLVAEWVQQWCWPQLSHEDHAGARVTPWFLPVQVSSPHPPLSPCRRELTAPPFTPYPHISSCFHSQYTSTLTVVSGESRPSILQTFYKKRVHFA